jgi:hypothetical protein
MTRATFLLALLVAGSGAGGPGASSTAAQVGPDERLSRVFGDGVTLRALWEIISDADDLGLPIEPLVQKALEGRSKGAADAQVVDVVRSLRARLSMAAEILGGSADEMKLLPAAGALYLGVEPDDLARVVAGTPSEALPMALVVLGDLVKRGVTVAIANQALLSLGEAGADAATLEDFRAQVELDIRTGVTPSHAAEIRSRGIVLSLRRGPRGGIGS